MVQTLHSTDEEMEAQRSEVLSPKSPDSTQARVLFPDLSPHETVHLPAFRCIQNGLHQNGLGASYKPRFLGHTWHVLSLQGGAFGLRP